MHLQVNWVYSTQANDVRDGPRVPGDRAGKPFVTRMFMRFPCSHWLIESMHWQLDVGLKEDACRIRVDDRTEVFARIRQMVLNLLKQEKSFKAGIQRKRMMCAMDQEYLATVLKSLL
ncbi:transposase family protein [Salinivibrio sp. VYel9]|nr:transposase family protein [Salinivibrio sp. VYel7]MPX92661.1 transposase family protein [Salinivibrio sp. VYel9]MPX95655.1 transposase family protein [Salinivibrio sp. VYel6]MPY01266.1 transposase family protein [Salinivibrio sp. VYel4]MPY02415.1 transposase family protein [Salinivibrio sp. VYel5]MPY04846.1 transposase family protein [Salinivibrio sp. VYel8]MPY15229.1 transposase family protein [Salinivibrio sp. VGrn1]